MGRQRGGGGGIQGRHSAQARALRGGQRLSQWEVFFDLAGGGFRGRRAADADDRMGRSDTIN